MRKHRTIVAMHLPCNALILILMYYWLGLGETSALALLWSFCIAAAIVFLTLNLHGATFAYFAGMKLEFRRWAPLIGVVAAMAVVYLLLSWWAGYSSKPAFRIASYLTLTFRKPVRPASVQQIFNIVLWLVRWMVVPVFALPLVAWAVSGLRTATHKWIYWIEVPVLLVCAFWIPVKLWFWVPHVSGFTWEIVSLVLRVAAAYLCFTASWLTLIFLTSSGNPRETQPSTVPSP